MLLSHDLPSLIATIHDRILDSKFTDARIGLTRLQSIEPNSSIIAFLESQLALAQGDPKLALEQIDLCIERLADKPIADRSNANYLRANILLKLGRSAEAVLVLEQLQLSKFNMAYRLNVLIAVKENNYPLVVKVCTAGIKAHPTDIELWRSLAKAQIVLRDEVSADASVSSLLTLNPTDINVLELACIVKFRLEEWTDSILYADRLLIVDRHNAQALAHKFLASIQIGSWEILPDLLEQLEQSCSESFEFCRDIYQTYTADRLASATTFSHRNLLDAAMRLYFQGDRGKALVLLESANALKPNDPLTQIQTATCLSNLKREQEAIELYASVDVTNCNSAECYALYNGWGTTLLATDRYAEAIDRLERAKEIYPDRADNLNNLAISYGNSGQISVAIEYSAKALNLCPTDLEIAICYCSFLMMDGQMDLAGTVAQTTLDINPLNPKSSYLIAMVLGTNFQFLEAFPYACYYLSKNLDCPLGNSLYRTIIGKIEASLGVDRAH